MISKFTIYCNILLTSAALAVPSSQLWDRLASRHENRRSGPIHDVSLLVPTSDDVTNSFNWAGAVMTTGGGSITAVTGTFTVPNPSGGDGAVSIGVGIDGRTPGTCSSATLQTGVRIEISNKMTTYTAWSKWYPEDINDASSNNITISANHILTVTVAAYSSKSGHAIVENRSTGQTAKWELNSTFPLCQVDAEWLAQAVTDQNGAYRPVVNFGNVTFTGAGTTGPNNAVYSPSDGDTVEMVTSDEIPITSVSTDRDSVTISYIWTGDDGLVTAACAESGR